MNIALSLLTAADAAAESGTIDKLQALGDAKLQVADPDYWGSVGIIALTGILVVFIILAILIFFFWAMGALFSSTSIKRKDNKARSAWSLAGIGENTRPF